MGKAPAYICISLGILSLLGAAGLYAWNTYEDQQAGVWAQNSLTVVQQAIVEQSRVQDVPTPSSPVQADTGEEDVILETPTEMTVLALDGYSYIGVLSIPKLSLDLPILSQWSYTNLTKAPCRQFGDVTSGNLVLAGHNYKNHFGYLNQLTPGDTLSFTDMDGQIHPYTVYLVELLASTDVEEVQDSGYDLVLYTCTYGGQSRIAVFCRADSVEHGA